ncbi:hypothetical protein Dxin01_02846 [Deinococcus xinjiangensis]|uniref:NADPH-dependent FMN reductase-like domain-containing protein n=1 Tax=Deinococcus xinjiangensis TaxID=457454 RepID=A0ABP9VCY5_9DEIO
MKVLALCGSLRAESVNLALLQTLTEINPNVKVFDGLRDLPLFNPDNEAQENAAVTAFRLALREADAVAIACPEYAHGIVGAFKNALDWVVGSAEFDQKPTLLLSALSRSAHAPAQLAEVLKTMGAVVVGPYSAGLPSRVAEAKAALTTPEAQGKLRGWLQHLAESHTGCAPCYCIPRRGVVFATRSTRVKSPTC